MSGITPRATDAPATGEDAGPSAEERRLNVLKQIALAGGAISPSVDPHAEHGYSYAAIGPNVIWDLDALAQRSFVERRFFDRVSLCPKCSSHHLNVREICPSCRCAHLSAEGLLHHFRCGYVGIPSEFAETKDGGYVCPKCNGRMHHLGTQYDRLGKAFRCRGCAVISENPPVEAVCLACATRTPGENLISTEVYSYLLLSRGAAAIRRGSLLGDGDEAVSVGDAPVYSRAVTLQFIEHYRTCLQELEASFSVIIADCHRTPEDAPEAELTPWLIRLRAAVREVDVVGQLADQRFIVLMPQTKRRAAGALVEAVRTALGPQSPFGLTAFEITAAPQIAQLVAGRNALAKSP